MKTMSIVNQKGGVGKTTTTLNLAVALQAHGKRVLMIDADQQTNLTTSVTKGMEARPQSLSELLYYTVAGMPYTPEMFIAHNNGLDIIAGSKLLAASNSTLSTASDSDAILTRALNTLTGNQDAYDFVLIDCPRSLDLLVTNCLNASDSVIIPTEPADYSIDGIVDVWETVARLQRTTNPELHVKQILINKFSTCKRGHHERAAEISDAFDGLVYPTPMPLLKEIEESPNDIYAMPNNKRSKAWPIWMGLAEVMLHEQP